MEVQESKKISVPIWEKILLTPQEASAYSNIGLNTIMDIVKDPQCDFIVRKGTHYLIKRKSFEQFLENISVL